jgi:hypothetical protein|tara:strand:- start:1012 stop:1197 length:186 start_codon:yes stop_codon:yes gene_type:complete
MTMIEAIAKIKELSKKLRDKNISDREVIVFNQELHRTIDILEVPELVNIEELIGENNEYVS